MTLFLKQAKIVRFMKVRFFHLFSLFFFSVGIVFAQSESKFTFSTGPELEERKGDALLNTFGHHQDFFFTLRNNRRRNGEFILEKIDTDSLSVLLTQNFSLPELKGMVPILAYPISSKTSSFLIATAEDPEDEDLFILAYQIGDDLSISKQPIVLGIGNRKAILAENGFLLFKTDNEEKIALLVPAEANEARNEKFQIRYFNSDFKLERSEKLEIPYSSGQVSLRSAVLSPSGTLHGVIAVSRSSDMAVTPDGYALLTYNPTDGIVKEKALSLGSKWFYDLKLTLTPDTNLWLAGYYSNMVEPSMAGTFSVLIESRTGDLLDTGLYPFDREFRLIFRSDLKSGEDDLGQFKLDQAYIGKDSHLKLISEKRYNRSSTIFNPATGTYSIIQIYSYDELLISDIRSNSTIEKNIVIPKYQSSSREEGRFTSYLLLEDEETTWIFYNDHVRNANLALNDYNSYRQLNNENNIVITHLQIDGSNIQKGIIDPKLTDDYLLDPVHHYETDNALILTTYKGYRTRYLKVNLPDSQ